MNLNGMRILVIGGSGFIGCSFSNWACEQGAKVTALSRRLPQARVLNKTVEVALADATDAASLHKVFDRVRPDVIVFSLSQIQPRSERAASCASVTAEMRSLLCTLECMSEVECKTLIYLSSSGAVYGGGPAAFKESDTCSPKSVYGKLKLEAEHLISLLAPRIGAKYSILRVSNPFGPGQNPYGSQGVIPIFINHILKGEPIQIFGNDQSSKDYIYIDDLNAAIGKSIQCCDNQILNLGSGKSTKLADLISMIESECGIKASTVLHSLDEQEVESFSIDITHARELLNWRAETAMKDGIRNLRRWIEWKM
jgi:UDP-glucose 4-epimerase